MRTEKTIVKLNQILIKLRLIRRFLVLIIAVPFPGIIVHAYKMTLLGKFEFTAPFAMVISTWGILIGYIIKFYFMGKGEEADND